MEPMKSAPLPTGTSQLEIKVTLRHRRQVNDTFSVTFDVEASDAAKERYLRWMKLCTMEATCGTPTPNGYTHTCGAHKPRTESKNGE
jgi:hypothetical protein